MIDETFLRQTAALQANLKMLESQQDALSDFQDMQALRHYKARLLDYIETHSKTGNLSPNPFQVIEKRLIAVSEFFTVSEQEYQRLTSWKKGWIKSIPNISLSDMQSAKEELSNLVAELPHVQQRLRDMVSALDWDTSSSTVDLYPELLACAQCVDGLKIQIKEENRRNLYQFALGEGKLANAVSSYLSAMGQRIEELISLHKKHQELLAEAEAHLAEENFRSAERVIKIYDKQRFPDIEYKKVDSLVQRQLAVLKKFADLDAQVSASNFREGRANLRKLNGIDIKLGSELEAAVSILRKSIEQSIDAHEKARKKSLTKALIGIFLLVVAIGSLSSYVRQELKKEKMEADKAKVAAKFALDKFKKEHQAGEENTIDIIPGISMTFCFCPDGEFFIKTPKTEADRHSNESQIKITITKGYWMTKTEVTNSQWMAVMGYLHKGDNFPVEEVSWDDTQDFLLKLNTLIGSDDGGKMVLPTESQWEYACRAGEAGPFSGGTIDEVAWYSGNSGSNTHPVGTKKPNAWGIHDMHGNVWEWCQDWYDDELRGGTDTQVAGYGSSRVNRGGCWYSNARECRADYRSSVDPGYSIKGNGFRVARISVP
jgi:formylglycine-generating enzyme required for sulfatase activity